MSGPFISLDNKCWQLENLTPPNGIGLTILNENIFSVAWIPIEFYHSDVTIFEDMCLLTSNQPAIKRLQGTNNPIARCHHICVQAVSIQTKCNSGVDLLKPTLYILSVQTHMFLYYRIIPTKPIIHLFSWISAQIMYIVKTSNLIININFVWLFFYVLPAYIWLNYTQMIK